MIGEFVDADVGVIGESELNGLIEREAQLAIHDIIAQMFRTGELRGHQRVLHNFLKPFRGGKWRALRASGARMRAQEWKLHTELELSGASNSSTNGICVLEKLNKYYSTNKSYSYRIASTGSRRAAFLAG